MLHPYWVAIINQSEPGIEDHSQEKFAYHCQLLHEAGFRSFNPLGLIPHKRLFGFVGGLVGRGIEKWQRGLDGC